MIWLYVATLVFGAAFVVPMLIGGMDFDADVGGDLDLDFDTDMGGDLDVDLDADTGTDRGGGGASGVGGAIGDFVASLLNFRSIVLGSTFFGLSGLALTAFGSSSAVTLITALVLGLIAAASNSALTTYVVGRQQSSHVTMRDITGVRAEVLLPISDDRRGRVRAQIAGQTEYFTALPHRPGHDFVPGQSVVVIEVVDGLARVASLKELEP